MRELLREPLFVFVHKLYFDLIFQESKSFAVNMFKGQIQTAQVFPYPSGNSEDIMLVSVWKNANISLKSSVENEKSCSLITCLCGSPEWGAGAVSSRACGACCEILRGNLKPLWALG